MSKSRDIPNSGRTIQKKMLDAGMIVLLGGILITVALFSAILGMRFAVSRTEVEVPEVSGQTVEEARKTLEAADLKLSVLGERYDEETQKGAVMAQFPRPGGRLKAHREVQVMVSLGARTNAVPNLIGLNLRVARLTAAEYNYAIGHVSKMTVEGEHEEKVLQQHPPPDSKAAVSPRINLLVSAGDAASYVMPDLLGRNLNEVRPFLERRGFKLAGIQYNFYRNADKGTVVKQFPEPGYMVTMEDSINLEVAR